MLSWVAMERIYEHEVLPDAKLRKQAGERPLRADAKRLTDGELLAKLRSFGATQQYLYSVQSCPLRSPGTQGNSHQCSSDQPPLSGPGGMLV